MFRIQNLTRPELISLCDQMGVKLCPRCNLFLNRREFSKNAEMRDGLTAYCKGCGLKYSNEWREKNADYVKALEEAQKQLRREETPEQREARCAARRIKDKQRREARKK